MSYASQIVKIRQKDISTIDHKIISFSIGENESSKYWLQMLNDLKNRGIKDGISDMCRWFKWNAGSYINIISKYRILKMYNT